MAHWRPPHRWRLPQALRHSSDVEHLMWTLCTLFLLAIGDSIAEPANRSLVERLLAKGWSRLLAENWYLAERFAKRGGRLCNDRHSTKATLANSGSGDGVAFVVATAAHLEHSRASWIANSWASWPGCGRADTFRVQKDSGCSMWFVSDLVSGANSSTLYSLPVQRLAPPSPWLSMGTGGDYSSHLYKFHLGLRAVFLRDPSKAWYGLVGDDTYVDVPALRRALHQVINGRDPHAYELCVGPRAHVSANMVQNAHSWMLNQCMGEGMPYAVCKINVDTRLTWAPTIRAEVRSPGDVLAQEVSFTERIAFQLYGAGIFCTAAAVRRLLPHLASGMTLTPARLYGRAFWEYVPPSDVVMNACLQDLDIATAELPFEGDGVPWRQPATGGPWRKDARDGSGAWLRQMSDSRPVLWHHVKEGGDFELLHYLHTRFGFS